MARYIYTAKSGPSQVVQGDIEAESHQEAVYRITKLGYYPILVKEESLATDSAGPLLRQKISNKDIVLFTRQLSILLESGVNILSSLNIISRQQASNKYLKAILGDVISNIKDGRPLSESLARHAKIFSSLYTSMIHSGEVAGNIDQALKRLADFLEKEEEFKNSVRAALTYPFFIFFVSAATVIVLLTFVIPRLVTMFEDMGQMLPLPTKMLINLSSGLRAYWWFILAVIFAVVFLLRRTYLTPAGRVRLDRLRLKIPVIGDVFLKTQVSRFTRTLSLLLSSGIPIVSALGISIQVLTNKVLSLEVEKFKEEIIAGASFSHCLSGSKAFPDFVTNIVTVGEETGTLEKSLLRIADEYEREVDRSLKALIRLLEPVIILIMGLIVGFIVLSMLLPIFQINLIVR